MSAFAFRKNDLDLYLYPVSGAFNDNVFKNALLIVLTYKASAEDAGLYANSSGLIYPSFFVFSPLAGHM